MSSVTGILSLFKIEPIAEGNCFIELSGKIGVAIKSDLENHRFHSQAAEYYIQSSVFLSIL